MFPAILLANIIIVVIIITVANVNRTPVYRMAQKTDNILNVCKSHMQ